MKSGLSVGTASIGARGASKMKQNAVPRKLAGVRFGLSASLAKTYLIYAKQEAPTPNFFSCQRSAATAAIASLKFLKKAS